MCGWEGVRRMPSLKYFLCFLNKSRKSHFKPRINTTQIKNLEAISFISFKTFAVPKKGPLKN